MKQHITKEQLGELSEKQADKLFEWVGDREVYLSIGQMIEFLDEEEADKDDYIDIHYYYGPTWRNVGPLTLWEETTKETLCNDLWKCVKEKLSKEGEHHE